MFQERYEKILKDEKMIEEERKRMWMAIKKVDELKRKLKTIKDVQEYLITNEEKYIIDKFILRNKINLIVGDMWSGKTNFALLLLSSLISETKKFFNWDVYFDDSNILYIDGENEFKFLVERWKVLIKTDLNERVRFLYSPEVDINLFDDYFLQQFTFVLSQQNIKIVVIDPLISFVPKIKENDPYQVRLIINNLKKHFCARGITPIIVHHLAKPKDDVEDTKVGWWRIRGSSDFPAGADMIWACIKDVKEELPFFVKCLKNRIDLPLKKTLYFDFDENIGFNLKENYTIEDTKSEKLKKIILEIMKNNDGFIEGKEIDRIVLQLKASSQLKWFVLKQLKDENKIISERKAGGTIYILTEGRSLTDEKDNG